MIAPSSATTSGSQIVYSHASSDSTQSHGFWIDPEVIAEIERLKAACSDPLPVVVEEDSDSHTSPEIDNRAEDEYESLPAAPRSPCPIRDIFLQRRRT